MRGYRRSRTDYPSGVVAIYDNGGRTLDRYTVVYAPVDDPDGTRWWPVVCMSADPYWPQGVCLHDTLRHRPTGGGWSGPLSQGRIVAFEDLPIDCQRVVRQDTSEVAHVA